MDKLSSTEPADWRTWRRNFQVAVRINGWSNQRARRTAQCSMTGMAATYVEDIPIGDAFVAPATDCEDYNLLLDLYQDRFMPRAAVDHLRAVLKSATQHENEGVVAWHQRARSLYMRAYPDATPAQVAVNSDVIDTFVFGLADLEVRRRVWHEHPRNYAAALTSAQNACSGQLMPALQGPGGRGASSAGLPELGALGATETGGSGPLRPPRPAVGQMGGEGCWRCGGRDHIQRFCTAKVPSRPSNFRGGRGGQRGRNGRGRRGGSRGGRVGGGKGRKFDRASVLRSLNAMGDEELAALADQHGVTEQDDQPEAAEN